MNSLNAINSSSMELNLSSSSSSTSSSNSSSTLVKPQEGSWSRLSRLPEVPVDTIFSFLHLSDLVSIEKSTKIEPSFKQHAWSHFRRREYKRYEWRDCERSVIPIPTHKVNFLLSHHLELLIDCFLTYKSLTTSQEDCINSLVPKFPQFGYVASRCIDRLKGPISPPTSDTSELRASIFNENQCGGTLLLGKLLLLIETSNHMSEGDKVLDFNNCKKLVDCNVTCVHLFNRFLKIEDKDKLAIAAAQKRDFRALNAILNQLRPHNRVPDSSMAIRYRGLIDNSEHSDLAPVLYHQSLRDYPGNAEQSKSLMHESFRNYQDGNINRCPQDALLHFGSILFKSDEYLEADQMYSCLVHVEDPALAEESNFFINRALAKYFAGQFEVAFPLLAQMFEKTPMGMLQTYLKSYIEFKLERSESLKRYENIDKLFDQLIERCMKQDLIVDHKMLGTLAHHKFRLFKSFGNGQLDKIEALKSLCDRALKLNYDPSWTSGSNIFKEIEGYLKTLPLTNHSDSKSS